jgi:hypothetical protein
MEQLTQDNFAATVSGEGKSFIKLTPMMPKRLKRDFRVDP